MVNQGEVSWSNTSQWRRECFERFGNIRQMAIARNWQAIIKSYSHPSMRILDIGAGKEKLHKSFFEAIGSQYFTLDVDTEGDFDYYSFSDVPQSETFDLMIGLQLLEHLTLDESSILLQEAYRHLKPNGYFLASVPNVAHPVRYWSDVTHVTFWPVGDFYGLFRNHKYDVIQVVRTNKERFPINPIKRYITNLVADAFRMDWCDTLLILAQKPSE